MPVHVSIHDVSPASVDEVDRALELCASAGARPALLVVPDWHGRAPLLGCASLCERLRGLQARGHDVYLHGLRHVASAQHGSGTLSRLRWVHAQRVASDGEAEWSGVARDQAAAWLDEGERVLRQAGLRVDGFVPPAWQMPRWMASMLGSRGYRYTEDHLRVYDPASGRSRWCVLLNWATRSRVRFATTVAWCRLAERARRFAPTRIAIHPADMRVPAARREVAALLARARGDFIDRGAALLGRWP